MGVFKMRALLFGVDIGAQRVCDIVGDRNPACPCTCYTAIIPMFFLAYNKRMQDLLHQSYGSNSNAGWSPCAVNKIRTPQMQAPVFLGSSDMAVVRVWKMYRQAPGFSTFLSRTAQKSGCFVYDHRHCHRSGEFCQQPCTTSISTQAYQPHKHIQPFANLYT